MDTPSRTAEEAEALLPQFVFMQLLNQDQAGRRISMLGRIGSQPALLVAERAAFAADTPHLAGFAASLRGIRNLGANDVYHWYLASSTVATPGSDGEAVAAHAPANGNDGDAPPPAETQPPDLKINLIYPCTEKHVRKYSRQGVRSVRETPEIYEQRVRPYMALMREHGRLNWVFNIIEGRTEQEDVIHREHGEEGFLLLPDLNWDRKTMTSLHLLGIVERRDLWSIRDLRRKHTKWLKHMRKKLLSATVALYPELEMDELKLYFHYQPTYYHLHIHIVHNQLDAGATQAVGKAIGFDTVMGILQVIGNPEDEEAGMHQMTLWYTVGEESDLWLRVFEELKAEGICDDVW